eukprot:366073-Chlamydomonas_euryale.AAC.12
MGPAGRCSLHSGALWRGGGTAAPACDVLRPGSPENRREGQGQGIWLATRQELAQSPAFSLNRIRLCYAFSSLHASSITCKSMRRRRLCPCWAGRIVQGALVHGMAHGVIRTHCPLLQAHLSLGRANCCSLPTLTGKPIFKKNSLLITGTPTFTATVSQASQATATLHLLPCVPASFARPLHTHTS